MDAHMLNTIANFIWALPMIACVMFMSAENIAMSFCR